LLQIIGVIKDYIGDIERMKIYSTIILFLLPVCLFSLTSCKTRTAIKGDIIAETNGSNRKLASVQVIAVPESTAKPYVDSNKSGFDALNAEYTAAIRQNGEDAFKKAVEINERLNQFTGADFYNRMPPGVASAISDGDGKFTLTLPKPGKYLLVASEDGSYWFIWVKADGHGQNITLRNANQTSGFYFQTLFAS
jgi:hypothetical protein